ncbi:MAG: hypothetical protein AABY95_06670 [Pseudomonadota bacterium]
MLRAALILLACVPAVAQAHTFGRLYTLPVPLWLYAWGAAAALVLSFFAAGYFMGWRTGTARSAAIPLDDSPVLAALRRLRAPQLLQLASVAMLLLTIATGFFGSRDPLRNFSMTAFWILFLLGVTYASAFAGNFYALLNPWRVLVSAVGRIAPGFARGRLAYPQVLDAWPALALYVGLIWFELTFRATPFSLAVVLAGYTLLNFAGVWLVGAAAWFHHCEAFSVFFRNVARLAPLDYRPGEPGGRGSLALRWPGAGALQERPAHLASVIFVLAMLAATAYDGLRETQPWFALFWHDPLGIVTPLVGERPIEGFVAARPWYRVWDTAWLVAAPFLYFGVYVLTVAFARVLTATQRPLRELLLDFAYALLPIVLAYHAAHYFTLLLDQGPKILSLASDPFGYGWNLFGTANKFRAAYLPDLTWVWHIQVMLILTGHVSSVVLAHRVALRVFDSRREAILSQLPMLVLMVSFTVAGLWIMAQPLTAMVIR